MMYNSKERPALVCAALDKLKQGRFTEDVYLTMCRYPAHFLELGVSAISSEPLMELKRKVAFCPDPLSYSIQSPERVDYLHRHVDASNIEFANENEKRFGEALSNYYYLTDLCRLEERNFFQRFNSNYRAPEKMSVSGQQCAAYGDFLDLIRRSKGPLPGREGETGLMYLPEAFVPLVEESGEFDEKMIDYVKVNRGMGRVTPAMAYNSMDYYISNRLMKIQDPDDSSRRSFPNFDMINPSEKFSPNLLSEQQWKAFMQKYGGEAYLLMPFGAFRKDRITDVEVYPVPDGGRAIRCKVDGQQQSSVMLSDEDARGYNRHTDTGDLAVGYFPGAFAKEDMRDLSMGRRS